MTGNWLLRGSEREPTHTFGVVVCVVTWDFKSLTKAHGQRVGHQPMALFGSGRIFKRWGLVEENYITDGMLLKGVERLVPSLCLFASQPPWLMICFVTNVPNNRAK